MATTETKRVSAKQLALRISKELDETISAKQLRVWLRNQEQGVGQGKRYSFTEKQAGKLQAQYIEYRDGLDEDEE
jgi:hypothetical protein